MAFMGNRVLDHEWKYHHFEYFILNYVPEIKMYTEVLWKDL